MTELTVSIKGSEQTYKQKFMIYETFKWSFDDPIVLECVETAKSNAKIPDIDDIKIRGLIVIQ